jgi:hypothetical protein
VIGRDKIVQNGRKQRTLTAAFRGMSHIDVLTSSHHPLLKIQQHVSRSYCSYTS